MDPEVIQCKVPASHENAICLKNITWNESLHNLWYELSNILSEFGLLYNIYVAPNKFGNDGYYAYARYYSKRAAADALSHKDSICINDQKVFLSILSPHITGLNTTRLTSRSLVELISYYFGFNYWSSEILYIEREPVEDSELKYVCLIRVTTKDDLLSEGVGIGVAPLPNLENGGLGLAHKLARKFAVENACCEALSKFVILEFANGKRLMEVDTTLPDPLYVDPSFDNLVVKDIQDLALDPEACDEDESENEWIENLSDSVLERLLNS